MNERRVGMHPALGMGYGKDLVAEAKTKEADKQTRRDWTKKCENCGETPIVPATGLCGPCTFGEADTAGGNW